MIKKEEVTKYINTVWEGVEASKVGRIIKDVDVDKHTINVNNLSFSVFMSLLPVMAPHDISTELKEPPEKWRGE